MVITFSVSRKLARIQDTLLSLGPSVVTNIYVYFSHSDFIKIKQAHCSKPTDVEDYI